MTSRLNAQLAAEEILHVDSEETGLQKSVAVFIRKKTAIIAVALGIGTIVFLVSFFLLPKYYKSTAMLLPENDKGKLSGAMPLSSIAEMAGINLSQGGAVTKLYPTILTSDAVLVPVIEKKYPSVQFGREVNLIEFFRLDDYPANEQMPRALKELRELFAASVDARTNSVALSLEMREPQLTADVLNTMIAELDLFMKEKRKSNASEQTKWITSRISEVEPQLRAAEERLKTFREKNRRVLDSPELVLEQERLIRDVQMRTTVYGELKRQYELSRIEEIKNMAVVNVLDEAKPAMKKERPKAAVNAVAATLITLMAVTFYFVYWPTYKLRISGFLRKVNDARV